MPRYTERIGGAPSGNIVNGLRELRRLEGFAAVRDLIAPPDDVGAALSELTAAFARVYLAHGTRAHAIAFVHAITGPAALRRLALHVTPATARAAFPYAWQAAAGIYAAYAQRGTPDLGARGGTRLDADELAGRAVEGGGDHAIKLTEVALAEHALRADAVYLEAAADAIARL